MISRIFSNIWLNLAIVFIGGMVFLACFSNFKLGLHCSSTPELITPESIAEKGLPSNAYVLIDKAVCVYGEATYCEKQTTSKSGSKSTSMEYVMYPVISVKQFEGLKAGTLKRSALDIRIFIQTREFKSAAEIPEHAKTRDQVKGVIVNSIKRLDPKEEAILKQSFPGTDLSKVAIIDESMSRPSSFLNLLGMLFSFVVGAGLLFFINRPKN